MSIGIISDTHDNIPMIKAAVAIFNERETELVIHAGDYIAPFAVRPLNDLNCQYIGVFGNNDGEKFGLSRASHDRIKTPPHSMSFGGKNILVLHEPNELAALIKSRSYDIIIYGHTHKPVIEKQGVTLVINPGECGGWLTGKSSIVLAHPDQMAAEIIELP
jgi:putative phosphoesterase